MKIILKRILICIMSMLLCIAMLPLAAFAAEAEPVDPIADPDHDWSEWTVVREATPYEEGEESRVCSICGEEETRVIPRVVVTGWAEDEYGYKQYFDENGEMVTGWKLIDGDWYYFEPVTGRMKYGGVTIAEGDLYYLADDGKMLTGWIEFEYEKEGTDGEMIIASDWYYADPNNDSRLTTGWKKIDGYWYFFEPKNKLGYGGYMRYDEWEKDSKGWCYLGHDGKMVTNDWAKDDKGWCWIGSNGYVADKTQWIKCDGDWYYIDKGYRVQNAWKKDSKGWCYLGSDGRMVTNSWAKDRKGYCRIGSDGYMVEKTQWIKCDGDWYYIDKGYRVQNAWKKDSKGWCYLGPDGRMVMNEWAKDSKGNCWIGPDGYMIEKTMLVTYKNETYGIDKGYMVVNRTITIEGKEYTFGPDGKLVP